jgi:hypothetical protein
MHSMTYMLYRELPFPIKSTDRPCRWRDDWKLQDYLETYENQLVGHATPLEGREEPLVVSRTNNVLEHRFGTTKQGYGNCQASIRKTRRLTRQW